jgi:hypothetical protein
MDLNKVPAVNSTSLKLAQPELPSSVKSWPKPFDFKQLELPWREESAAGERRVW